MNSAYHCMFSKCIHAMNSVLEFTSCHKRLVCIKYFRESLTQGWKPDNFCFLKQNYCAVDRNHLLGIASSTVVPYVSMFVPHLYVPHWFIKTVFVRASVYWDTITRIWTISSPTGFSHTLRCLSCLYYMHLEWDGVKI